MKDIPCPHLLLKFQSKICKSLVLGTCPILICCQKIHANPLGFNDLQHESLALNWEVWDSFLVDGLYKLGVP